MQGMGDLPEAWTYVLLVPLGIVIATYGTLIGAGGGILTRIIAGGLRLIGIRLIIHAFDI
jgi:hypothetical protein